MSPRLEITQDMRIKICALRDEGFPFSAIANKFNISKNGVKYTIDRFNESGEYVNRIGRGRKRCTSDADDKNIILMSKRNRKMTAPDIREAFNSSHSGSPWAKKYVSWTDEDWRKVLFTDESKFELFGGGKRRHYVRRMQGERMLSQCVVPTVKHGGGSVMVWGCFANGQTGSLKKVEGILKK
ncbi:uncharacterized protein LOC122506399 [Leptopilina heterotoma]|uniref:uncharacterized protein LOC122506399 n=1 Tax=Leptopilina heterotoma TaxID=63436 RepID=UPI001CAA2872|nr:uncharacterized protein LOC122506399 [Leptopilina heterotoma]